jgi:hypothetical protein
MHPRPATRWCRWLAKCGLTPSEMATVLDVDIVQVECHLRARRYTKTPVRIPAWFHTCGPLRARSIRNETATYLRRLHEVLAFPVDRIAAILVLKPKAVADFISRLTPAPLGSAPSLVRPRSASEQRRVDATLRRRGLRRRSSADRPVAPRGACHDDEGSHPLPPAAPPAVELHQVEVEVPPPAREPWDGPTSPFGGQPKLTEAQALEVCAKRAAGWSVYELADAYEVTRNTIYRLLRLTTYPPPLPCPDAGWPENAKNPRETGGS